MKITSMQKSTINENYINAKIKIQWKSHSNMQWTWLSSNENVEKYDNKKLKIRHEYNQKFLINRLNETCQNRLLLKTFAQLNCIYFCT